MKGALRWTGNGGEVIDDLGAGRLLDGGTLECLYADSWCKIGFRDGTNITLFGRTVLTISLGKQKELSLLEGSLSANVAPQPKGRPLLIHTSTAKLDVLGTQFDLVAEPSSTQLSVAEGHVLVTRLMDGSVAEVPAEHQIRASADVHEGFSVQQRPASVTRWKSSLPEGAIHGQWLPEMAGRFMGLRPLPSCAGRRSKAQRCLPCRRFSVAPASGRASSGHYASHPRKDGHSAEPHDWNHRPTP